MQFYIIIMIQIQQTQILILIFYFLKSFEYLYCVNPSKTLAHLAHLAINFTMENAFNFNLDYYLNLTIY